MKPCITDSNNGPSKKISLLCQVDGLQRAEFAGALIAHKVVSYGYPANQSLQEAWLFFLTLDSGWNAIFSSVFTEIGEWKEVGCLNVTFSSELPPLNKTKWTIIRFDNFFVESVEWLVVNNDEIYVECGLVVKDALEREIVVATGVSPGSVSISLPLSSNSFRPEFATEQCARLRIKSSA